MSPQKRSPLGTVGSKSISSGWKHFPPLLIFTFAFLLYGNTLWHDYALDDSIVVSSNEYTKQGFSGLGKIFTTDAFEGFFGKKKNLVEGGRYRPLSIATLAIEWAVAPNNPHLSHFINVVLYGLCGHLAFIFLRMLFPEKDKVRWWMGIPFLLTLLFMAHPIHTEVVANIKGRDEIMALLFLLGGMIAAFKYLDAAKAFWLPVAAACFLLAMLSKETPLPFVFILPMAIWFFRKQPLSRMLLASAPFAAMAIVYLVIRFSVLGLPTMGGTGGQEILNNPFLHATPAERLATVVETWGIYLVKLFAPVRLSSDYYFNQIPITSFSHPMVLAALAVNLGLLLLGIWRARKKDPIGFGILFYFISFSITSNLLVSIGTTMGERFVFIPSMGFLIAVVFGLHSLALRLRISERSFQYAMIAVVAVPFAIRTVARNQAWKDNHTLFTTDARISPRSAKIRTAAGGVMIERAAGKGISPKEKNELLHGAITHLRAAIEIYPEHGTAWILLGNAYHELKDYQNSLDAYREAIRNRPNLLESYKNAAVTARKMHQYALAGAFYKAELDKRRETHAPEDANYWFDRGKNYEDWGSQPDSAIWAYRTAIQLDPRKAEAYGQMGRVYGMQLNDLDHAIEYGEKAVALDPKLDWVYENIGIAYGMKKDYEKSIAAFLNGIRIRPTSGKLYMNLALTYQNMGDATRAQAAFAKAFELDPSLK